MTNQAKQTYLDVPYSTMVQRLFKQITAMPHGSVMHAAAALLGEAVEWKLSTSRKNFIEEAGDIEFYIEALSQHAYKGVELGSAAEIGTIDSRNKHITLNNVFDNVASISNDLFDIAKKAWVYGKPIDGKAVALLMAALRNNLSFAYMIFGTSTQEVLAANKLKLIGPGGRYESGFYSDAQAIARKDKLTGEDLDPLAEELQRKFIGKTPE